MHEMILGITMSGKTFLAKQKAKALLKLGFPVIVFDPLGDPYWACSFKTDDKDTFMRVVRASRRCICIVDECSQSITNYADADMLWTAQRSRHLGHKFIYISQRAVKSVDRNVRDMCTVLYCFLVSLADAKELKETWSDDRLLLAAQLPKYHFLYKNNNIGDFRPAEQRILKV